MPRGHEDHHAVEFAVGHALENTRQDEAVSIPDVFRLDTLDVFDESQSLAPSFLEVRDRDFTAMQQFLQRCEQC